MTSPIPDVLQGSTVTLVVRGRNFTFSLEAVAKGDGMKGEPVTVQRAGSLTRVHATVVDQRTVEMKVE
jgi:flagella basal body P-ring formation protein FlgA